MRRSFGTLGLATGLLSGITFGTSGSFASSLIVAGWSPGAAVLARVAIAAAVMTLPALMQLRSWRATRGSAQMIAVYGVVAIAGAQLCYFNAVAHLSVAVALLLEYSGIILVIAWGWLRHGNAPRRLTFVAAAAALAGLVLVLDLVSSHHLDTIGLLWAAGAAVGLAAYFILAFESGETVPPLVMAWGGLAVGAVVLGVAGFAGVLPVHATSADVTLVGRPVSWVVPVLGLSIVAAVVAYLAGIVAVRRLGAKLASFLGLTEVLAAVFFAWLLLGQRLDAAQFVGGALVIGGIALMRLDELRGAPAIGSAPIPADEIREAGESGSGEEQPRAYVATGGVEWPGSPLG